jgi:hypothetical protein
VADADSSKSYPLRNEMMGLSGNPVFAIVSTPLRKKTIDDISL